MTPSARSRDRLRQLLETGSIPSSACGASFMELIAPLLDSGVVYWGRSGGGRTLSVSRPDALDEFIRLKFPDADFPMLSANRVVSVAGFRDTKVLPNNSPEIICTRAWRDGAIVANGVSAEATQATRLHGVFAFLLNPAASYQLFGKLALVENPTVFAAFEQLKLNIDAVIYGQGRISNRILDWLASAAGSEFSLLHLPDYDPVGLSEFQRLNARLGSRCELHVPANLEDLFARFSNPSLLLKPHSQLMHAQLRDSAIPAVRHVARLIDRFNGGLEQEALLLT